MRILKICSRLLMLKCDKVRQEAFPTSAYLPSSEAELTFARMCRYRCHRFFGRSRLWSCAENALGQRT